MTTLEDIKVKKFERAMFGGYSAEEVDTFLDSIAEAMTAMETENKDLRAKLTVLADKIQEYRAIEDGIKDTLLAAQKMSAKILEDAKEKAGDMLSGAEKTLMDKNRENEEGIRETEARYRAARDKSRVYAEKLILIFESYISDVKRQFEQELGLPQKAAQAVPSTPPAPPPPFSPAIVEDAVTPEDKNDILADMEIGLPDQSADEESPYAADHQPMDEDTSGEEYGYNGHSGSLMADAPQDVAAPAAVQTPDNDDDPGQPPPASFKWRESGDAMDIQMVEITLGGGDRQRERKARRDIDLDMSEPRPARAGIDINDLRFGKNYTQTNEKDKD